MASLVVLLVSVMWGQGLTGSISGVVKDPNGAVVPSARVTVRNAGTNATSEAQTDETGYYRVVNLVPGNYIIVVEVSGFRTVTTAPRALNIAAALRQDVTLEIGQVTETVTVNAAASQLNTEDAQMGRSLTEIPNLPNISGINGRNPLNLVGLQPGVSMAVGSGSNAGGAVGDFSVNGQRTQANNYMLDGADSNDLAINTPDALGQISPNALQEFRVITGAMKAEYGRNGGAVIEAVVKSGTNQFHGAASEVFRNTKLNAVPFFQKVTPGGTPESFSNGIARRAQWNTNDFDAQFEGPIRKDVTFVFLDYLGFRRRQGVTTTATVFTDADRAAINAYGVPAAKAIMGLVPAASTGNNLYSSPANMLDRDQGLVKLDQRFGNRNNLSGTFFIEKSSSMDPFAFQGSSIPGFGQQGGATFTNYVLRDTHTFSPTLINTAIASFHRHAQPGVIPLQHTTPQELGFSQINPDDAVNAGPPWIAITGYSAIGNTFQGPQSRYDNTWQWADAASWIKGKHAFKFGGDYRAFAQNQQFTFVNNGYFVIDGSGTQLGLVPKTPGVSDPLNDFIHGFATVYVQNSAARQGYRDRFASLYAQDDWKLRRNLTLNLGVRWEYGAPLTELRDRLNTFRAGRQSTVFPDSPVGLVYPGDAGVTRSTYNHDRNNFGPRVGLAWDPLGNGKLSIRAGAGMFYDVPVSELTLQFLTATPYGIQPNIYYVTDMTHPFSSSQMNPMSQPFPYAPIAKGGHFDFSSVAPIPLTVMDPHFATPYSMQWNYQVQYEVRTNWLVDASYVGTTGRKLLDRKEMNWGVVTPTANAVNIDARRIYNLNHPQAAAYGGAPFGGITDQLSDANSAYNSLQLALTKRFSHGLQMSHSYTWSHSIDDASGLRVATNPLNSALDRGNSEFDIRHRYVGTAIYQLPWLKDQHGMAGRVLGGWSVSTVATIETGMPFDITEPQDRCLCAGGNQRPDYLGGEVQFFDPHDNRPGKANQLFDVTNFGRVGTGPSAAQGAGRYGNLGRNVFHAPGRVNFDLSLAKAFKLYERHTVELRGEAFNVANHTNWRAPNGNIGSSVFGRVTGARDPRLMQFSLRYGF